MSTHELPHEPSFEEEYGMGYVAMQRFLLGATSALSDPESRHVFLSHIAEFLRNSNYHNDVDAIGIVKQNSYKHQNPLNFAVPYLTGKIDIAKMLNDGSSRLVLRPTLRQLHTLLNFHRGNGNLDGLITNAIAALNPRTHMEFVGFFTHAVSNIQAFGKFIEENAKEDAQDDALVSRVLKKGNTYTFSTVGNDKLNEPFFIDPERIDESIAVYAALFDRNPSEFSKVKGDKYLGLFVNIKELVNKETEGSVDRILDFAFDKTIIKLANLFSELGESLKIGPNVQQNTEEDKKRLLELISEMMGSEA